MYVQNGVNYGDLVECATESGIEFYVDKFYLDNIEVPLTVKETVVLGTHTPLYSHLRVEYIIDDRRSADIYVKERTDAVKLAAVLGSRRHRAVVTAYGRSLIAFKGDQQVSPARTLDDFFDDVTVEERAQTNLF